MPEKKSVQRSLGMLGEDLAVARLQECGYRIVARNFRCVFGEIDIIAEEGEDLVFVEVKARRGRSYGLPEEAVHKRKQHKLIQVAQYYLAHHGLTERSWRIDVVAIDLNEQGASREIRLYQHAVIEE